MKMQKVLALLLAFVMVFGLLTGCAKTEDAPAADAPAADQQGATSGDKADAPGATEEQPSVTGRTDVNLVFGTVLGNADPHDCTQINGYLLFRNIYESLFFVEDDGSLTPKLAESYELADDGVTYTFHLRKGVKFHNGEEMKASDIVFSYEHAAANPKYQGTTSYIQDMEIIDDYTVKMVCTGTYSKFIQRICNVRIMSEKAVKDAGDQFGLDAANTQAGTGPYFFTEFKPDQTIKLQAFPDYWRGEASIKNVNYNVILDTNTATMALEAGEVDFISCATADYERLSNTEGLSTMLQPSTHVVYLKINLDHEPLDNKLVRQAIAYAIDKEAVLYGGYDGYGDVAENFAREGYIWGGTTDGVTIYDYNPEKAKELLAEAGYPNGLDIGGMYAISTDYRGTCAQIVAENLADVGITCELNLLEQTAVEDALFYAKTFDIGLHGGLTSAGNDSDAYFDWFFNPNNILYLGDNLDPRLLEIGNEAKYCVDEEKCLELYKEFWQIEMDGAFILPIFHRLDPYAFNSDLNAEVYTNYYEIYDWSWK